MRIIITGSKGFIGSHLSKYLTDKGHEIIGVGRNPEEDYVTDIRFGFPPIQFDELYHLACPATTKAICENPIGIMSTIIDGTRNVLKACDVAGAKLLFVSTIGKHNNIVEGGQSAYNTAKMCMENYVYNYNIESRIIRLCSIYGKGMKDDHVISKFYKAYKEGVKPNVWNGNNTITIAHIDDAIEVMVELMESDIELPTELVDTKTMSIKELSNWMKNIKY